MQQKYRKVATFSHGSADQDSIIKDAIYLSNSGFPMN